MGTHQKFGSAQPTHGYYFFNFRPMETSEVDDHNTEQTTMPHKYQYVLCILQEISS
jgi:hypothetical protein